MNDRGKICLFSFSTQFENLGDCVINDVLIREICRYQRMMILGPRLPDWLARAVMQHGNVILFRGRLRFTLQLLKLLITRKPLMFFFKPGHMVKSPGLFGEVRKLLVTALTAAMSLAGVRICRAGTSLDRYRSVEKFAQVQLGRCHALYGVRDHESLAVARQFGIKAAVLTPDLAFLLPLKTADRSPRDEIGLSFRRRDWIQGDSWTMLIKILRAFVTTRSLKAVVIQQVQFDQAVSEKIQSEIQADFVQFSGTQNSADDIFERYERCRMVVSNRLHSLLFAWMQGAIPIAVIDRAADQKLISLFEQYGLLELIVDVEQPESLASTLELVHRDTETFRARLRQIAEREQSLLQSIIGQECVDNDSSPASAHTMARENQT